MRARTGFTGIDRVDFARIFLVVFAIPGYSPVLAPVANGTCPVVDTCKTGTCPVYDSVIMTGMQQFLLLVDAYGAATNLPDKTISWRVLNDSGRIGMLRS